MILFSKYVVQKKVAAAAKATRIKSANIGQEQVLQSAVAPAIAQLAELRASDRKVADSRFDS